MSRLSSQNIFPARVKELSVVPLRPAIPAAPLSAQTLAALITRISECNARHKHSQPTNSNMVPDRLVDVQPPGTSADLGLVEDTSGITGPYLALSHCWGGTIPYRTLKSNKDELCRRIDFCRLSRSLQDAVTVTRWLNFRYIWIDSFCIVQDDVQDWLNQSSKIASIYSGAFLTIYATKSASYDEGFLSERDTDIPLPLSDRLPPGLSIYVRDCDKLELAHMSMYDANSSSMSPLFRRAWAFQERLLSQRVLHFMEPELVLECEDSILCECGEQNSYGKMTEKELYRRESNRTRTTWEFIVELYKSRNLTYANDILPAISAIARDYGITQYLAGLEGDMMMSNLVWTSTIAQHANGRVTSIPTRPPIYTAPSFSWASLMGPIIWNHSQGATFKFVCQLDSSNIELENPRDPFGRVKDEWIKLLGRTIAVQTGSTPRTSDLELESEIFRFRFRFHHGKLRYCR